MNHRRIYAGAGLLLLILLPLLTGCIPKAKSKQAGRIVVVSSDSTKSQAIDSQAPVTDKEQANRKSRKDSVSRRALLKQRGAVLEPASETSFKDSTTLRYGIYDAQTVFIGLYDGDGGLVRLLHDELTTSGYHEVLVESKGLPAGMYYVRLKAAGMIVSRPVVVL